MFKWLKKKIGYYDLAQDIVNLRANISSLTLEVDKEISKLKNCGSNEEVNENMRTLSKRLDDELALISKAISLLTETDKKFIAELEAIKKDSQKIKAPSNRKPKA